MQSESIGNGEIQFLCGFSMLDDLEGWDWIVGGLTPPWMDEYSFTLVRIRRQLVNGKTATVDDSNNVTTQHSFTSLRNEPVQVYNSGQECKAFQERLTADNLGQLLDHRQRRPPK